MDLSDLIGSWLNTDRGESGAVLRLVADERGGGLHVRGLGAGGHQPDDWGEAEATPFAPTPTGDRAWAFTCAFELGPVLTELAAYHKEGILVLTTYNSFGDDSGRADYWTREFFHREEGK